MRLAPVRPSRKPEVQISPLIDVIFLLLIFYAVTTQFITDQRLKLKLPEAKTAEAAGEGREEQPPLVKVAEDGTVWIDDRMVSDAQLETAIRRLVERSPEKAIILQGDRLADYGVVVKVLDIARSVGAEGVQMSAQKPPPPE
jgi:biopolymer transport protein ExbD